MSQPATSNPSPSAASSLPLLLQQLNEHHPLVKLSQALDWSYFEQEFGKLAMAGGGRPSHPLSLVFKQFLNGSEEWIWHEFERTA